MKRMTSNEYNPCFNCNFYSSCSHIRENFPVCPERARYDLLAAIEDILGDEYDLDELKEVVQAKREGRCVVLDDITVADLRQMLSVLDSTRYGDSAETYTTGYRNGHRNGRIEILRHVLGIYEGTRAEAQAALRREQE